jgi:hypothetical protein
LLLPFIFIFSPEILMIDIGGPVHFAVVVATATLAMMAFVAALQGYFFARNRWWEAILLLLICFSLFRPHFWMDMIAPPFRGVPGADIVKVIDATPAGGSLRFKVETTDIIGDPATKTVRVKLGAKGDARARLAETGITLALAAPTLASVRPGSEAARLKLRPGDKVESVSVPNERPSPFWFTIPAILALAGLAMLQRRRRETRLPAPVPQAS